MFFHILQCIKNLSIEDLAQLTLLETTPNEQILSKIPGAISYIICSLKVCNEIQLPEDVYLDSKTVAKLSLLSGELQRLQQNNEVFKHLIDLHLQQICRFRHVDEALFKIDEETEAAIHEKKKCHDENILHEAFTRKKKALASLSAELEFEKTCLAARIDSTRLDLQKINQLTAACNTYEGYLNQLISHAKDNLPQRLCQNVKIAHTKLKKVTQLSHILTNQDVKPKDKLIQFDIAFQQRKETLSARRDTGTSFFLKIVASVLSLGLAAPWIWAKSEGAKLSDCLDQTLMGQNTPKLSTFEMPKQDECEHLMQPNITRKS